LPHPKKEVSNLAISLQYPQTQLKKRKEGLDHVRYIKIDSPFLKIFKNNQTVETIETDNNMVWSSIFHISNQLRPGNVRCSLDNNTED